ncbi:MAG: NAD-binding protein [Spirochaetaceae bacterium]|jgi:mannitol-1-phosphate 5-dehydrogenase|nr:NAD-binding protein [Spirochaetaceae bacterium]
MQNINKKKLVQFGAGNIGRSFIGQLFARNGWDVVFIDIDETLVKTLNERKEYKVYVKATDKEDDVLLVTNIRAVNGKNEEAVIGEIESASMISTSVGSGVLPYILPVIARGILKRNQTLDFILAENIRNGARFVKDHLKSLLPEDFPLDDTIGLVETSIGKMVPLMKGEDKKNDPLAVFSEAYNKLIVDRKGFRGQIPLFSDLHPVDNIAAYVDRKLFIHNLGHAASAYLGYAYDQTFKYIWQVLDVESIYNQVRSAMVEAAEALVLEYPDDLNRESLQDHIDDLLFRFQNKSLGDTIYRVGRDLYRKLNREDRIVGAIILAQKHGLLYESIKLVYKTACKFKATDENGDMFERDKIFHQNYDKCSIIKILKEVSFFEENNF